jgi:NCS1 family nucleobase:cation symporter-1
MLHCPAILPLDLRVLTLNSYQIFLASILGVSLCDYFFVRKGYVNTEDLFHSRKDGIYHYTGGWNWRAYAAYLAGMVPVFPGFLDSIGVKGIPVGAIKLFYLALPVGIFVGAAVYYPLNYFWPPPGGMATKWHEEVETSFLTDMEMESSSSIDGVEVTQVQVSDVEKKV